MSGRGATSWRCVASVRADIGAAELAGGGRQRCARVGEERCVGEGHDVSEKSLSSGTGTVRRGGVATMTEEERRGGDLGENG
jgi:hypothetical protein